MFSYKHMLHQVMANLIYICLHGKCSKFFNTFQFLFTYMYKISGFEFTNACENSKQDRSRNGPMLFV